MANKETIWKYSETNYFEFNYSQAFVNWHNWNEKTDRKETPDCPELWLRQEYKSNFKKDTE